MNTQDQYKLLIGAYYGVKYLDEYALKEYLLSDIRKVINDFINENKNSGLDFYELENVYEKELTKITKFQDAIIVLHDMNASLEAILLIRARLKEEQEEKS